MIKEDDEDDKKKSLAQSKEDEDEEDEQEDQNMQILQQLTLRESAMVQTKTEKALEFAQMKRAMFNNWGTKN